MTCFQSADVSLRKFGFSIPLIVIAVIISGWNANVSSAAEPIGKWLRVVASSDGTAESNASVAKAAAQLESLPSSNVDTVLDQFSGATVRGKNWLRSLAADIADNGAFPAELLGEFYSDRSNDRDGRYVAFQLLVAEFPERKTELLANAETDPSLPVRYLKVQSLLSSAEAAKEDNPDRAQAILRSVVSNARSPKQLEKAAKLLDGLGVEIDLATELGMIQRWQVVGPFDNTGSTKFDFAYPPESRYLETGLPYVVESGGTKKPEQGKSGPVDWVLVESEDSLGMVDLNEPLENAKDAVGYAFVTFTVPENEFSQQAQIRIGCVTANKVWVNGQLVSSNEVYHSGTRIDQYVDQCSLVPGENTVLIKVMQNAQTEPWAQDWQFQFRLTRDDGSAIQTDLVDTFQDGE